MNHISLEDVIDAFLLEKPNLKMKEIKEHVFKQRGRSYQGYNDKYSFDQTIQAIVNAHCEAQKGYKGKSVFLKIDRGFYRLNPNFIFTK